MPVSKFAKEAIGALVLVLGFQFSNSTAYAGALWSLSNGGVWDIPAGKRVVWNPLTGNIGNMGNAGLEFAISPPPGNIQAGAIAQASQAYLKWNSLGLIPSVRINIKQGTNPNSTLSWGDTKNSVALGETSNSAVNSNDRDVVLNQRLVVRSDRWNYIVGDPVKNNAQYDSYTIGVHEAGHVIGLNHPRSNTQIMSQTGASLLNGGRFKSVEKITPFAGQPLSIDNMGMAVNPLLDGTKTYNNPRAFFGFGDALGAITLYSAPVSIVTSLVQIVYPNLSRYVYTIANLSAHSTMPDPDTGDYYKSAYDQRSFTIPVHPGIPIALEAPNSPDMCITNQPLITLPGYSCSRDSFGVHLTSIDPMYNLKPGDQALAFSFLSLPTYSYVTPLTRWAIRDILSSPADDPDSDDDTFAPPAFNINDFSVLDGSYVYDFDYSADAWKFVKLQQVATPVPSPLAIFSLPVLLHQTRKLRTRARNTNKTNGR